MRWRQTDGFWDRTSTLRSSRSNVAVSAHWFVCIPGLDFDDLSALPIALRFSGNPRLSGDLDCGWTLVCAFVLRNPPKTSVCLGTRMGDFDCDVLVVSSSDPHIFKTKTTVWRRLGCCNLGNNYDLCCCDLLGTLVEASEKVFLITWSLETTGVFREDPIRRVAQSLALEFSNRTKRRRRVRI
jgi:hypothetical protein